MNVVFDSMGTLFRLTRLHARIGEAATEAWFERTLHSAATLTILGEFAPFDELARATLSTTAAMLDLAIDEDDVFAELKQLPPAPDAREALERAGRSFVLTNGGRAAGEHLLERAGLSYLVERVFGVDEVRAFKPDPRPYRHVVEQIGESTLVAAHAWDCLGARNAGMQAVWIGSEEQAWPFPTMPAPKKAETLVDAVAAAQG
ncbi:MAG TPA: HAD-IA family hydrolase [Gaiellaceae bacterium]|nr:HAD-IA family hydrolase [Gaiellaceae bacterium]